MSIDHTDTPPQTSRESFKAVRDANDDVALRKRVAAHLCLTSATTLETTQALGDASRNAVRPRINELIRMGCVRREGKRENPSGKDAYIHHITETGRAYVRGEVDPTPNPPLSELQAEVVTVARAYCAGEASKDALSEAVKSHDDVKQKRNPEWDRPHHTGLSAEKREQIKNDPVLEISDFE